MPPKHSGETFNAAVGDRSLWYPRRVLGWEGVAKAILGRWMFYEVRQEIVII